MRVIVGTGNQILQYSGTSDQGNFLPANERCVVEQRALTKNNKMELSSSLDASGLCRFPPVDSLSH